MSGHSARVFARGGRAAPAGGAEPIAVDPFAFDGSQDEAIGAVLESGAPVRDVLEHVAAAAPGAAHAGGTPDVKAVAPAPAPRRTRNTPPREGQSLVPAAPPADPVDPFDFEVSDDAKRFENVPPVARGAAPRLPVTAVAKRVTWGEPTVVTLTHETPPADDASPPQVGSTGAGSTIAGRQNRSAAYAGGQGASRSQSHAQQQQHEANAAARGGVKETEASQGAALAALDDVRFCMDGLSSATSPPAVRAAAAADVATHLADAAIRRALRTHRLWAPMLYAASSLSTEVELRPHAACLLCLLACCDRLSGVEADALAQPHVADALTACLTALPPLVDGDVNESADTAPAQSASSRQSMTPSQRVAAVMPRLTTALRRARAPLSPREASQPLAMALLVCDVGCSLPGGGPADSTPRGRFKALLHASGALSGICTHAHEAASAIVATGGTQAADANVTALVDAAAVRLLRCTRVLEHVCFEAEECAQHVLSWPATGMQTETPAAGASTANGSAAGQLLPAVCGCLAPLAARTAMPSAPPSVGTAMRSALAVVTNVTNERPQAAAALLACGGVATLAQLLRPLAEVVLPPPGSGVAGSEPGGSAHGLSAHADALNAALCALANVAEVCPEAATALGQGEHLTFVATLFARAHALTNSLADGSSGAGAMDAADGDGDDVTLEELDAAERSGAAAILSAYCALLLACLLHAAVKAGANVGAAAASTVAQCQADGGLDAVVVTVERFLVFHSRINNSLTATAETTLLEAIRGMQAWQR